LLIMSKMILNVLLLTVLLSWVVTLVVAAEVQAAEGVESKATQKDEQKGGEPSSTKTATSTDKGLDYIAIVGGERISINYYIAAVRKGIREKFYHGKTPEAELKRYRKEVAEQLVSRLLSIQEAKRRGIKPDSVVVKKGLEAFDQKFKDDPKWPEARERVLKQLKEKLQGDSLAELLEKQVRSMSAPNNSELEHYYETHKDLFTTPARERVSLILLKVDPSSGSKVWEQASKEANNILERINKGADFADMARIHSGDESAQNGGDMGSTHSGMLGDIAQKVLDLMEPGEVSSPVILLEGIALFRLESRVKSVLNPLQSVRERASSLYQRDSGEQAWKELGTKLQATTKIEYNDAPWR
jgi:parvulin-like peptidyl-prolyl isomerase